MALSRPVPYEPISWSESKPINLDRMDTMDYGILNSFYQSEAMWLVDDSEEDIVYSGTNISELRLYEAAGSTAPVLRRRITLNYTSDDITSINAKVYEDDGATVLLEYTDTLTYSVGGNLDKVSRSVVTMPTSSTST